MGGKIEIYSMWHFFFYRKKCQFFNLEWNLPQLSNKPIVFSLSTEQCLNAAPGTQSPPPRKTKLKWRNCIQWAVTCLSFYDLIALSLCIPYRCVTAVCCPSSMPCTFLYLIPPTLWVKILPILQNPTGLFWFSNQVWTCFLVSKRLWKFSTFAKADAASWKEFIFLTKSHFSRIDQVPFPREARSITVTPQLFPLHLETVFKITFQSLLFWFFLSKLNFHAELDSKLCSCTFISLIWSFQFLSPSVSWFS